MIEQGLLTRSDIASTAPNAQQEPQDPWSRISPMVGQFGQAVRASNSSGIAAPLSSTKSDSTSRLSGSLNLCASGWTPINPRIWWSGKSASKLRPTCVRESLMRICCHVSNSNLNKTKKKYTCNLLVATFTYRPCFGLAAHQLNKFVAQKMRLIILSCDATHGHKGQQQHSCYKRFHLSKMAQPRHCENC